MKQPKEVTEKDVMRTSRKIIKNALSQRMEESEKSAKTIQSILGNDWFNISDMIRRVMLTSNPKHPRKLSWHEANSILQMLKLFGLIEVQENKGAIATYRVRLDKEYRINYFSQIKEDYKAKISDINAMIALVQKDRG